MELKNIHGTVIFTLDTAKSILDLVVAARRAGANLCGADLRGADLCGKKIIHMRVFAGLYYYQVHSVLFEDGSRWIRMGCLFKSLEEWENIGIRNSNLSEFPDDGSDKCEDRAAAFEFAKAAVLRMKMPELETK